MTRPSALAHADTRKRVPAMDPTLASSSPIDRAWRKRKAGNEPTSLGVTPHGVRDPGALTNDHQNGTAQQPHNARNAGRMPSPIQCGRIVGCRQEDDGSTTGPSDNLRSMHAQHDTPLRKGSRKVPHTTQGAQTQRKGGIIGRHHPS